MAEHLRNEEGALQAHEVVLAATTLPALDALPPHGHVAEATLDGEVLRLTAPEGSLKSHPSEPWYWSATRLEMEKVVTLPSLKITTHWGLGNAGLSPTWILSILLP